MGLGNDNQIGEREEVVRLAQSLIGKNFTGHDVTIRITEVEAYAGPTDPASHAYRRTPRSESMYGEPWRLYVYRSHGIHWCVNIVTGPSSVAGAVLLRAGQIIDGVKIARERRGDVADARLASGPGNLGRALAITGADLGVPVDSNGPIKLEPGAPGQSDIQAGPRVGVAQAADIAWRFWVPSDPTVSAYRRSPRAPAKVE